MATPLFERDCGVLLHPTSLPGPLGIGDLGPTAWRFLAALSRMEQSLWQFLPLNPPDSAHSPYQARSAFANDVRLVSLDALERDGWLTRSETEGYPVSNARLVDSQRVAETKLPLIARAAERLCDDRSRRREEFADYAKRQASWLDDYAVFMALKQHFASSAWTTWPLQLRDRDADAIAQFSKRHARELEVLKAEQFLFDAQFRALRARAHELGIRLIGDLPIFVAHDSVDVWCHPALFLLEPSGEPRVVAGVPPDYFSATGQRWGNPLYDWSAHERSHFAWWVSRISRALEVADIVRIDHFRGFAAHWEIPASAPTAIEGRWVEGPGATFFQAVIEQLGTAPPIIAEDLGLITDDVIAMKEQFGFPGMRVMQFSFGGKPDHFPDRYPEASVAYTGTHDNDTLLGWYRSVSAAPPESGEAAECARFQRFLGLSDKIAAELCESRELRFTAMRALFECPAQAVIVPLQDVLGQGSEARMNVPGLVSESNWAYRFLSEDLTEEAMQRVAELTQKTGRGSTRVRR